MDRKKMLCWLFKEKKSGEKRASIAASEKKLGANACWSQESERDARSICSSYCRIFLSRPNWKFRCVCLWMCWLGSAPLRTSHSKSYGWWFSYSFFQTHTWFNSNSIFFCFLPFVLFRHHTILFSLCFGEGTFSLFIFFFLKREFSFFCSPFVCMQGGFFTLFLSWENVWCVYMYNNIGEVLLYDCKTFLFAATQSKERQEHFFPSSYFACCGKRNFFPQ